MRWAAIMAGGGGTRLWPASRRNRPKQLLPLGPEGETLLQATGRRLAPLIRQSHTLVITSKALEAAVRTEVPVEATVIAEPVGRNTAAAIGLAVVHAARIDPEAVVGAFPADHYVRDEHTFRITLDRAFTLVERDDVIVTLGIEPTAPETGFGYLELGAGQADPEVFQVKRFVEKPQRKAAEDYLASGRYLWNAGLFFFRARRMLHELSQYMPATHAAMLKIASALAAGDRDAAARATAEVYPSLPDVSIDHGVMERAQGIVTIRGSFGWSDVGTWSALADIRASDPDGNVLAGTALLLDAQRNVVVADRGTLIALLGVDDLVVVQAGDAVLVARRDRVQDVKELVRKLERSSQATYL